MALIKETRAEEKAGSRKEKLKRGVIAAYATPTSVRSSPPEGLNAPPSKQLRTPPDPTIKTEKDNSAERYDTPATKIGPQQSATRPQRKGTGTVATRLDPDHPKVLAWAREVDQRRAATDSIKQAGVATVRKRRPGLPAAEARNEERLRRADVQDKGVAGEWQRADDAPAERDSNPTENGTKDLADRYLPSEPKQFFHQPIMGPDDSAEPPPWFLREVVTLLNTTTRTPTKSPISFVVSPSAAAHNASVLDRFGWDLSRLIGAYPDSTLGYGSEFRGVGELTPLLRRHPSFAALSNLITHGMPYIFNREIDAVTKREEMETLLERGNHKSAIEEVEQVTRLLAKDVHHGFSIPLPVESLRNLKGAAVQPLGIAKQWTVMPDGARDMKFRLTQDLTFTSNAAGPSRSINDRVDMTSYAEMVYGWCLLRIIHYVVSMRANHPNRSIFICKYDYSDAYRRIAHSAEAAIQTIAVVAGMAYLALRLTFGGSPNPPSWCLFSEVVTDLANEIGQCPEWNPSTTFSPAQAKVPDPIRLSTTVPWAQAKTMSVTVPYTTGGRVDGFIDDLINVFLDSPDNLIRQTQSVPLAMHITSRPHAGDASEPIPRRPILSQPKLAAEGSPAEVQIVLGWKIDTRRLLVSLPDDKFEAWVADLRSFRNRRTSPRTEIETLVGRLNHTAAVLPEARHFLSRIRATMGPESRRRHTVRISDEASADLRLWEEFLAAAHRGVSLNLLVTRTPDRICWSDACPYGIGGYTLSGRAWRIQIPRSSVIYGNKKVNNLLEFLGMVINIWVTCEEPDSEQACILAIGDNTSAIGWLHSTSRLDPTWAAHGAHLMVARTMAKLLMKHNCCLASQHLKGELNLVADWLSFVGSERGGKTHPLAFDNPPDDVLTERFHALLSSQIPVNFVISPLPNEILSWVTLVLRTAESYLTEDRKAATKVTTGPGGGGPDTATLWATELTPSSLCYPSSSKNWSSAPSSASIGLPTGTPRVDLPGIVRDQWSRALCDKPQASWLRRSGQISGRAPCTSRDPRTCDHPFGPCCGP
jgi:hypothetical protein